MPTIQIANAAPGAAQYTSANRARELVSRGRARWSAPSTITLTDRRRAQPSNDGNALWWNGSAGPYHMHRPGEVIS